LNNDFVDFINEIGRVSSGENPRFSVFRRMARPLLVVWSRRFFVIKMYTKFGRIIKGFAVSFALAVGVLLVSGTTANAQYREYYGGDRYYRVDRGRGGIRSAYQRGYRAGFQQGIQAARYGGRYGGYGYSRGFFGNEWGGSSALSRAYQSGFNRGYRDGLNRYRHRRSGFSIRLF
jgi:hypothetical protein